MTLTQVAVRFGVSASYVSKVRARLRDLGDAGPGLQHGHVPLRLAGHMGAWQARIKASPDATLNELRTWLSEMHKVSVSYPVMWADHDLRHDERLASPAAARPRHTQRPPGAQTSGQLTTQSPAALDVKRLVDGFMALSR
jgi:transposase